MMIVGDVVVDDDDDHDECCELLKRVAQFVFHQNIVTAYHDRATSSKVSVRKRTIEKVSECQKIVFKVELTSRIVAEWMSIHFGLV